MRYWATLIIAAICGTLISTTASAAGVNSFAFHSMDVVYTLTRAEDGTSRMQVHETLNAAFPDFAQNKGITRAIPRTNQDGKNLVLPRQNIIVKRNGISEPIWEQTWGSEFADIATGTDDYVLGNQEYTFEYEFKNIITEFDDHQELYWDINGTDWFNHYEGITFGAVTAAIKLDASVLAGINEDDLWCYTGTFGMSNRDCTIELADDTVYAESTVPFGPGENITIAISFALGTFVVPEPQQDYSLAIVSIIITGLAMLILFLAYRVYRDEVLIPKQENQVFVKPEYQPPKGISLAGAADIYSNSITSSKVISAQIVDLAVRGVLKINEKGKKKYTAELIEMTGLTTDERALVDALFHDSAIYDFSTTKYDSALSTRILKYNKSIKSTLKTDDFLHRKAKGKVSLIWVLMFFGIFILPFVFTLLPDIFPLAYVNPFLPQIIALPIASYIAALVIVGIWMSQESKFANLKPRGWSMYYYMLGLKDYIHMAEAERIRFHQSPDVIDKIMVNDREFMIKMHEKLLPYAMIFGDEKQWAKLLEVEYGDDRQPTWYSGTTAFHAAAFATSMSSFSSSVSSNMSSTGGSSSSSSGGGGGGSYGGGGGGGGGGGR